MTATTRAIVAAFHTAGLNLKTAMPFSTAFKLLGAILMTPLLTWSLQRLLARHGKASVGNFEIAQFLLSPEGVVTVLGGGAILMAMSYLELAGLQLLLADRNLDWSRGLKGVLPQFHRLVLLGLRQLSVFVVLAIPFLAAIYGVYQLLWAGKDLNGLIILKPREFWLGGGLAAAAVAAYLVIAGRWFLQWLLAVPTLLFEPGRSIEQALASSTARTNGQKWRLAVVIVVWALVQIAVSAIVLFLLDWASVHILSWTGDRLTLVLPVTATLLVVHGFVLGAVSVLGSLSLASLILEVYRAVVGPEVLPQVPQAAARERSRLTWRWLSVIALVLLGAVGLASSREYIRTTRLDDHVEFTAHRAGATHAPENTVAAIRRAISDGAEWAEIDVQLTSDKELVVLHDIDLARIGGGKRRVEDVTLAEIRELDIGTKLKGAEFAGERVPTLAEILEAAGSRIRLNVELKPHGRRDEVPLTEKTVAELERFQVTARTRLCSQSYESIQLGKKLAPDLQIGFIAAKALGDLSKLDVDFLMVSTGMATRALVERAALRGIKIHAWTVNDRKWVAPLLDAGVDNIITDDPLGMRGALDEIRELGTADRILLRVKEELRQ